MVEILRNNPHVRWAQVDHPVTMRETIPNDPDFGRQWALRDSNSASIFATYAWDFGKGGKTIDGADVVVAVVDQGVDVTHPSLIENLWVNHARAKHLKPAFIGTDPAALSPADKTRYINLC